MMGFQDTQTYKCQTSALFLQVCPFGKPWGFLLCSANQSIYVYVHIHIYVLYYRSVAFSPNMRNQGEASVLFGGAPKFHPRRACLVFQRRPGRK